MSIFPTRILLATDGSREAELAFASAADLSEKTGSELHVVYVGHMPLVSYESPGATSLDPDLQRRMQEGAEQEARTMLEELVRREGEHGAGVGLHPGAVTGAAGVEGLAGEVGARVIASGRRGLRPFRGGWV